MARGTAVAALLLAVGGVSGCSHRSVAPLRLAAASSLGEVLSELVASYQHATGVEVQVVLGGSDQLARQIEQGAPYDLFASADPEILTRLEHAGILADPPRVFATGRLVAWVRGEAPQQLTTFADVAGPGVERIAIANPELAPFGRAAREALNRAGLEALVAKRLVLAENVQQAWRFAATGNADVALTALSVLPEGQGRTLVVDPALYSPLGESLGVVRAAPRLKEARAFADFVLSAENRPVFLRHGLGPPDPESR